jgi:hypothetical protein
VALRHEQRAVGGGNPAVGTAVEYLHLGDLDHRALTLLDAALRTHDRAAVFTVHTPPVVWSLVFEQLKLMGNGMSVTVAGSLLPGPLKWSVILIVAVGDK